MIAVATLLLLVGCATAQQQNPPQIVGFTLGQTSHLHITKGDKIVYNKNITEIGANVDPTTGVFTCQIPGVYVFSMYSLTRSDGELWLELMKNNELVASIYAYTYADYADAGNAAVLKLQKGDTVYVKAHDDYDNSLYGEASQIYTTLTGELVFPDAKELDSANAVSAVGFTAALSVNASLPNGTQVVYDHVVTNVSPQGGGYDATTGTFTAPIDGAYVFHFYAVAHSSEEFWLELFHNNDFVESSYGYTSGSYADAGNTAVLHL
uniref:Putative complement C1q tumor necrosis factor-related protein 4-like protein n=1 Tax=Pinctada fucata TaxID=50426 RepID=A0A194AMF8_PINFU